MLLVDQILRNTRKICTPVKMRNIRKWIKNKSLRYYLNSGISLASYNERESQ